MKLGVTGGRSLESISAERRELFTGTLLQMFEQGVDELHHGGCLGVDELAHYLAILEGVAVVVHPPDVTRYEAKYDGAAEVKPRLPYLERNRAIVDHVDSLLALPSSATEVLRSGSWATVRYARKARKELIVY